jgi:RimJ/RimL family protein N-acetyltransferase
MKKACGLFAFGVNQKGEAMSQPQVRLRPISEKDLPNFVVWFNDPEVAQFMKRESGGFTLEIEQEWFRDTVCAADPAKQRFWAIDTDGVHIGSCALNGDKPNQAAFGICIGDKNYWGKGCGKAALQEVLRIGFQEMNLHRIRLTVFTNNQRGMRCYEANGFRYEGIDAQAFLKRGVWIDVLRMAILRDEWEAIQAPPQQGLCQIGPEILDEVLAVWKTCELWPHAREDRASASHALAMNARTSAGWRVDSKLVGTATGAHDGFRGWLYRVAVHPDQRRQGLATKLVSAVEERLVQAGVRQINLMVVQANDEAQALYKSLGYSFMEAGLMRKRFNI